MDNLAAHPRTNFEYWFFKVNSGSVALLVDWIARRGEGRNLLRVSIHSPEGRVVLFEDVPALIQNPISWLTQQQTKGQLGDIRWQLTIQPETHWIHPQLFPATQLQLPDMRLSSLPQARFNGWIEHGKSRFEIKESAGMVAHYWGRQLPPQWWWISVNQFDQPNFTLEAMVVRSHIWGIPIQIPLAYLFLRQGNQQTFWIAPPTFTKTTGNPNSFAIQFQRLGSPPIRFTAQGTDYGDLGDSIINTLCGNLTLYQGEKLLAQAIGTAGLERRHHTS